MKVLYLSQIFNFLSSFIFSLFFLFKSYAQSNCLFLLRLLRYTLLIYILINKP
ncbi:putative membrane protein [Acinetobacter baumannii 14216]|uniref:Putative membrane protein n=1 Tax=Acinetobacter baumannii 1499986 TaxID=1310673 RepID=A0A836LYW3_ACIBA|nr:putative membrane protein [Acinetobacter baumannii 951631]EXE66156.1 putative membrane protein [Acinetobacter baumannii 397971]EXG08368.1 putative membrane protein [Acinetobacter baumannii 722310]EXH98293.1 putative membrane protein [Acinetobacter baumannii 607805]EXI00633.1 putative membrane protein [Acinetobacter baumannii 457946]EXQ89238.1 putative membrane protein [Acinetobacter baumannii 1170863]EXR09751.1 putative membrane protein [Acinetobacter baumannii 1413735]EXR68156.1 putative